MPMKIHFHPIGITFSRIYGGELSLTKFGYLPKKRAFYREN